MKTKISKALYLSLIIFLMVLGIIIFMGKKSPAEDKSGTSTSTSQSESEIDTSSWRTYVNEKWGYSFKYPKDWYLEESTIAITIVRPWDRKEGEYSDPTRDISVRVLPNNPSELPRYGEGKRKGDITVGGKEAMEYQKYPYPGAPPNFRVIYIPRDKELYEIKIYEKNPDMDIFNQILKSFTFIK